MHTKIWKVKVWHDDIRRPPDDTWHWCRTNQEVKDYFTEHGGFIREISLDHDLGMHLADPDGYSTMDGEEAHNMFLAGRSEETGQDIVEWLCFMKWVPPKVTIHSWNPEGARFMAARLAAFGHNVIITPFVVPEGMFR